MDTVFDWEYDLERENPLSRHQEGKAATWNASDLDWSIDGNLEKMLQDRLQAGSNELFDAMLKPPRTRWRASSTR